MTVGGDPGRGRAPARRAGLPPQRPEQRYAPPYPPASPPGGRNIVRARQVIISGPNDGLWVYNGAPGPGKLLASIVPQNGPDGHGNEALAGVMSYNGNDTQGVQLDGGALNFVDDVALNREIAFETVDTITYPFSTVHQGIGEPWLVTEGGNNAIGYAIVPPSNDTSGATDTQVFNELLLAGMWIWALPNATYYFDAPIVPSTTATSGIRGFGCLQNNSLRTPAPTTLKAVAGFSGTGLIEQTTTAASPIGNFRLEQIHLDLTAAPNITHGLYAFSNVYGNIIRDVSILGPGGAGTGIGLDLVYDGVSGLPDGWDVDNLLIIAMGNAMFAQAADMIINRLHGIQSVGDGARIRTLGNSLISNSRMANGGANGWNFGDSGTGGAGPDGTIQCVNLNSQINAESGALFDWPTSGGQMVNVSGFTSVNDGQAGAATDGGIKLVGGGASGMTTLTSVSVAANANGPFNGLYSDSGAVNWQLANAALWATGNPLNIAAANLSTYRAVMTKLGAAAWALIADSA